MKCVLCLFVRTGLAPDAVTVSGGFAVCEDHASIAGGADLSRMIDLLQRESK